eukprot:scaffold7108_cov129-Isochrysis_galbana.AAC.1
MGRSNSHQTSARNSRKPTDSHTYNTPTAHTPQPDPSSTPYALASPYLRRPEVRECPAVSNGQNDAHTRTMHTKRWRVAWRSYLGRGRGRGRAGARAAHGEHRLPHPMTPIHGRPGRPVFRPRRTRLRFPPPPPPRPVSLALSLLTRRISLKPSIRPVY